jgi:hypothetical protein
MSTEGSTRLDADPHAPTSAGPQPGTGTTPSGVLPFGLSDKLPPAVTEKIPPQTADKASELAERPEVLAGAAFAGGVVVAQILKLVRR